MPSPSRDLRTSQQADGAPTLVEVIFELRWGLGRRPDGRGAYDPGYEFLLGRFLDRVKPQYPVVANLAAASQPVEGTAYVARHQFRSGGQAYPLIQLGPGVLMLNDDHAYQWGGFRPRVAAAVESLFDCYPSDRFPLTPTTVGLRYINTLPMDPEKKKLPALLREKLNASVSLDPALFEDPTDVEDPCGLDFKMTFPLPRQEGFGTISVATGLESGKPCLILQLEARAAAFQSPGDRSGVTDWIEGVHETLVHWYRTLSRGA
jgi:uncharacterized protein (TIGR04255 family)